MKFSIVTTTLDRPCLSEALDSVKDADEVIVMRDDFNHRKETVTLINEAARKATGDMIIFIGERHVFAPDWKERTLIALEKINNSGLVSFWENISTAGGITKDFLYNELGGNFWSPDYIHYCVDIELADVARKYAKYIEVLGVVLKHHERGSLNRYSTQACADFDRDTYNMRALEGWPNKRFRTDQERMRFLL